MLVILLACVWAATPSALAGGNIDPTNQYAWGANVGWINAAPTHGGVTVYFNGTQGYLTGLAWGENIGWIKMGNDAGGPYVNTSAANWGVNINSTGTLSGYAWGENVGWINFSPSNSTVSVDLATGSFSGKAWGDNIGWISFKGTSPDYRVRTTAFDPAPPTVPCRMRIGLAGYTNRTETLTNFPVLVVLTNNMGGSGFSYSNFISSNGHDLRFATNSTGTNWLNHEIESWNPSGASYVWVQVPAIPGDGSGALWASWGNSNAASQLPCTTNGATWTNGYEGVWHLARNGSSVVTKDSTVKRAAGTPGGSPTALDGLVDGAVSFATTNDRINLGNVTFPTNNGTVSFWWRPGATNSSQPLLECRQSAVAGLFDMYLVSGTLYCGWYKNAEKRVVVTATAAGISVGSWQYLSLTWVNGGVTELRVNGVSKGTASGLNTTWNTSSFPLYLNYDASGIVGGSNYSLDEVTLSSKTRSTNWLWACYLSQASNTVFNHYGTVAVVSNSPATRTLTVVSARGGVTPGTITVTTNSALSQIVTNSPVSGGAGTQYVCTAGVVVGNAYTLINPTNVTLTLTNDATLTWQWQTQYWLTTATNGNGTVTSAGGWYVTGASTVLTATAATDWRFAGWTGNTNGCVIVGNVITVVLSQARSISARFAANVASNGTPYAWLALYGLTNGALDAIELADPDLDGLVTWKEWVAGTDPTNAGSVVALAVPELDYGARTLLVRWVAGTNAWRVVERHYGFALTVTSAWLTVYSNAPGGPATGSFVDSVGTNQWIFYRVRTGR